MCVLSSLDSDDFTSHTGMSMARVSDATSCGDVNEQLFLV